MLSQAFMDRLGREATRMQGSRMELVTYHARATATAAPVDHAGLQVLFRDYRLSALSLELIALTDQECVIRTALVPWTPTKYDDITRVDGKLWKVISVRGGRNRPHFLLQTHQVG